MELVRKAQEHRSFQARYVMVAAGQAERPAEVQALAEVLVSAQVQALGRVLEPERIQRALLMQHLILPAFLLSP